MKKYFFWYGIVAMFLSSPVNARHGGPDDHVLSDYQRNVITYFKEIALGFEFGSATPVTRKWVAPMKIYVGGAPTATLTRELELIIAELNGLATDGFQIQIVSSREASNLQIFFGTGAEYAALYPVDAKLSRTNSGVYHIYWNSKNQLTKGHIFVNMKDTSEEEQRHVIREELTQSLGLGRDSELYQESVFQSRFTTPTHYAEIDKDLIRLLYHPAMRTGLTPGEVEAVLTEILLSEKGA